MSVIFNDMLENLGKYKDEHDTICIAHGDSIDDANLLAEMIKDKLPHKQICINYISPSIGAHSGPGAIGLCFMGERR